MPRAAEGFEEFAQRAMPRLLRTAWLLCGDAATAEDLVQESLVRLYAVWHRVRSEEPEAYCHRILRNTCTSQWRRSRRLVVVEEVRDETPASGHRPDWAHSDQRLDLVRALQSLPSREREVVVLRHYADLSEQTVAEMLGVSVGTVKSSASRGLTRLRAALSEKESEKESEKGEVHVR